MAAAANKKLDRKSLRGEGVRREGKGRWDGMKVGHSLHCISDDATDATLYFWGKTQVTRTNRSTLTLPDANVILRDGINIRLALHCQCHGQNRREAGLTSKHRALTPLRRGGEIRDRNYCSRRRHRCYGGVAPSLLPSFTQPSVPQRG